MYGHNNMPYSGGHNSPGDSGPTPPGIPPAIPENEAEQGEWVDQQGPCKGLWFLCAFIVVDHTDSSMCMYIHMYVRTYVYICTCLRSCLYT